jgi:glutamate 5-kinase
VINENDSVATDELRYGDNDRLSARVAQMVKADLLVLLSDVDGLHTADPAKSPGAEHVATVENLEAVEAMAGPASGVGSGGMRSKLAAARIASGAGCATLIASGREDHPLAALQAGARATLVTAKGSPAGAYKQWIAGTLKPAGSLTVDAGAAKALAGGKSLLPAGVTAVEGSFERGVCLSVRGPDDAEFARGISAYNSDEARAIAGQASARIEALLGYGGPDALIHRDDLVMLVR